MAPVNKKRRVSYPPEAEAEIAKLREALQLQESRAALLEERNAKLEATVKATLESTPPNLSESYFPDQAEDITIYSLDGNVVDVIAKFLDGISLLNWVKACRSALISPSLFVKHVVRKHTQKPIDSECFFSESPLENQEELRCELLLHLTFSAIVGIKGLDGDECPDVVGNVAEWLDIDADSQYAKCMAYFLLVFLANARFPTRALSKDIITLAESLGFRCLPSVSLLPCFDSSSGTEYMSLFDALAMKTQNEGNDDLKDDCYNYRTSKLPSLATLIKNTKTAIEREFEQDSDEINELFAEELIDDVEHEQSASCTDIEAWLNSDDRQRYTYRYSHRYGSRIPVPEFKTRREDRFYNHHGRTPTEYADEEMRKYKQEVFEALDRLSEQEAGLVEPEFRLSTEKFDEVFVSALPSFMRTATFAFSRSTVNILQQIVEQIHFGSLWKFPVQHESLILGDSRWNGILLLSEDGMSVMVACEEMDAAVDEDDEDSEYEPECETTEDE